MGTEQQWGPQHLQQEAAQARHPATAALRALILSSTVLRGVFCGYGEELLYLCMVLMLCVVCLQQPSKGESPSMPSTTISQITAAVEWSLRVTFLRCVLTAPSAFLCGLSRPAQAATPERLLLSLPVTAWCSQFDGMSTCCVCVSKFVV